MINSIAQNIFEATLCVNEGRVMSSVFHGFSLVVKAGKLVIILWILTSMQSVMDLFNAILRSENSTAKSVSLNWEVSHYLFRVRA